MVQQECCAEKGTPIIQMGIFGLSHEHRKSFRLDVTEDAASLDEQVRAHADWPLICAAVAAASGITLS